uniref:hypothetical protein n=1 Tax=Streptomyces umbrinus TaxID=67370 RepID=UPI0035713CE8
MELGRGSGREESGAGHGGARRRLAPTPARAVRLSRSQIGAALKRAGRKRGIDADVERLRGVFRAEYAHQPPLVEDVLGRQMLTLLQLEAACTATDN